LNPSTSNLSNSSSSRPTTDVNSNPDTFDLTTGREGGEGAMHGTEGGSILLTGERPTAVPTVHTVKKGDTLWDLCDRYFHNPWDWPRVWSYNPDLQNPHWIYPGDLIRLRSPGATEEDGGGTRQPGTPVTLGTGRFIGRRSNVPPNTIFLRDQGYIDDQVKDVWGEVGGSPDDQLLLSEGDHAYVDIAPGHDVAVGDELTVFRPMPRVEGGKEKGTMVTILGSAKVDHWDPKTRVARARLTESLNVIERGAKVGPVTRRFEVVPPSRNQAELEATIMASFYPHVLFGQNQLVFIDHGKLDGLAPGNRLFAIVHGDAYRKTLPSASRFAASRVEYEGEGPARTQVDGAKGSGDDNKYPLEVIGEIRVLSVRDHTATCIVTTATRELERGQKVIARKGY
jgi:nucleoid-associated protein YgaU